MTAFHLRQQTLLKGIALGSRTGHAHHFYGPDMASLKEAAHFFAQCLNCEGTPKPCGRCKACQSILSRTSIDVFWLEPEARVGIEVIRTLQEQTKYGPAGQAWMIVIIADAYLLTIEASNAFLKLLEEPPAKTAFLLLSHSPYDLSPTIYSRCQHIDFFSRKRFIQDESTISFSAFTQLSKREKLSLAKIMGPTKDLSQTMLENWTQELWENPSADKAFSLLDLLIENLLKMKYNLNLRLQLEALFLQLDKQIQNQHR